MDSALHPRSVERLCVTGGDAASAIIYAVTTAEGELRVETPQELAWQSGETAVRLSIPRDAVVVLPRERGAEEPGPSGAGDTVEDVPSDIATAAGSE